MLSRTTRVSSGRICTRCLFITQRFLSSDATSTRNLAPPPPPPPPTGYAHLKNRTLISVYGHDAPHFLQGLTTANIVSSPLPRHGFYSAFLNAKGRVLNDVFIYPTRGEGDLGFLIDVAKDEGGQLKAHLKKFKLRAKVKIGLLEPGEGDVWGLWGEGRYVDLKVGMENSVGCVDSRAPGMGIRIVTYEGAKPADLVGEEASVQSYDVRRTLMGVAEGQHEILKEEALPQESNIDYMGGIDFRKGCYVGQELTIRTHHTGIVRKRILPVQTYPDQEKEPEKLEYNPKAVSKVPNRRVDISRVNTTGRSAGKWLSGMGNIGLALCRLEIMTDILLTEGGNQWKPEQEFQMAWKSDEATSDIYRLKAKAFVPEWHRNRPSVRDTHRQLNS
ncbi:MAG: hypothetical protein Q9214_001665 [Letrouitia sp. 1 TL-2023]